MLTRLFFLVRYFGTLLWRFLWGGDNSPRGELYAPGERLIYRYFDGQAERAVDPMVLLRALMEKSTDLAVDIKVAQSASKDAGTADAAALAKLREIFGVKALAEGGLTDMEVYGLFSHFWDFTERLKKNTRRTPTFAGDPSPPTAPSGDESPPTPSTSASGSTAAAPPTASPTPLPSEPPPATAPMTPASPSSGP